jgi:hypothetical protein
LHGKLSDCVETGEGASNQLQGSIKFDAPALISILDTEITNHRTAPIAQKQRPDWKETGRANDSLSQLLPGSGRQRSGLMFIEQLAYPTVTDSSSTAISWRAEPQRTQRSQRAQ